VKKGLWFYCSVCNAEVKGWSDCPFTIGRWNEHIKPGSAHCQKLDKVDVIAEIRKKSKSGEVSTSMSSCNWMKSTFTCTFCLEIEQDWDRFAQKW
jgi:hypothetical protein